MIQFKNGDCILCERAYRDCYVLKDEKLLCPQCFETINNHWQDLLALRRAIAGKTTTRKGTPKKKKYADYVSITEAEYQKLVSQYGEAKTRAFIDTLDNYKGARGRVYKSDYRAILNWVVETVEQKWDRLREKYEDEVRRICYICGRHRDEVGSIIFLPEGKGLCLYCKPVHDKKVKGGAHGGGGSLAKG